MQPNRFYVYVLFRPTGVPCYVGKGDSRRKRMDVHEYFAQRGVHRNKHLQNIIKQAGGSVPKVIVRENLTKEDAYTIESALIVAIGRRDLETGPLVNLTNGGPGVASLVMPRYAVVRVAAYHRGRPKTDDHKRKIAESNRGQKRSVETRRNISISRLGRYFPPTRRRVPGTPISLEGLQKRRSSMSNWRWITDGIASRFVKRSEILPVGWQTGRTK